MPARRTVGDVMCDGPGDRWNVRSHAHRRSLRSRAHSLRGIVELGLWFDFPRCCIDAFVQTLKNRQAPGQTMNRAQKVYKTKMSLTHVPCRECADTYFRDNSAHAMVLRSRTNL